MSEHTQNRNRPFKIVFAFAFLAVSTLVLSSARANSISLVTGKGRLGAQVIEITDELRKHFGARAGVGVLVAELESARPAHKSGMQVGDVIMEVNGTTVDSVWDIHRALQGNKKGDQVAVTVVRSRKTKTLMATLDNDTSVSVHAYSGRLSGNWPPTLGPNSGGPMPQVFRGPWGTNDPRLEKHLRRLEKRLQELEKKLRNKK